MIPSFQTYAGPSSLQLFIGSLTIWFSYDTPVAYRVHGEALNVSRNEWAQTTGKHLNAIDGGSPDAKRLRVPHADLVAALELHLEDIDRALEGLRPMA